MIETISETPRDRLRRVITEVAREAFRVGEHGGSFSSEAVQDALRTIEDPLDEMLADERRTTARLIHERTDKADADVASLRNLLAEHERARHPHLLPQSEDLRTGLASLLAEYRQETADTVARTVAFRDDLLTYFRALAIVIQTVDAAGTHREKSARLRGLAEVVEAAVQKLRDVHFDQHDRFWWPDVQDVMRADWPYRRLTERVRELEAQLAEAKAEPVTEVPF